MTPESLCMGCMRDKGSAEQCPYCAWREESPPESPLQLPPRTILNGSYLVGRALGQGGFGITYLAWDLNLNRKLAVKEYFPRELCTRARDECTVQPLTPRSREAYESGLRKFLDEGRALASFQDHPGIVSTLVFFQENGTAYIVMAYMEGLTFKQYLEQQGGKIDFEPALNMLTPVIDTLKEVHRVGMLHRDISPDNIYVTRNGQVKLLDFGNARYAMGEQSQSLDVILKPGYAPEEQYRSRGRQGPWTDVYALSATLYRAVTGQTPSPAPDRMAQDDLVSPSRLGIVIRPQAENALLKALALRQEDRFQSVDDFQNALMEKLASPTPRVDKQGVEEKRADFPAPVPVKRKLSPEQWRLLKRVLLGSVVAVMAVAAAWVAWSNLSPKAGRLTVTANVVGATIAIDQQNQPDCVTPCDFKLPPGKHHVVGTKPGYASVEQDVTIEADQGRSVNLSFQSPGPPPDGRLTVTANVVGAQIAINGQSRPDWVTPCDVKLPAGEYRVAGTKAGYGRAEQDVTLAAGQSSSVNLELPPGPMAPPRAAVGTHGAAVELPGRIKARITEGEVDYQHGQYDEAIHALREAIALKPGDAEAAKAHRDLGMALSHKKEWDEAIRECRTAIRLNPNDALAHSELGVALGHKGDWNGTITEEQAAVRLDANNALSHYNLGVALKAKGDQRAALDEFRKAHALDPANPGITANYMRLLNEISKHK